MSPITLVPRASETVSAAKARIPVGQVVGVVVGGVIVLILALVGVFMLLRYRRRRAAIVDPLRSSINFAKSPSDESKRSSGTFEYSRALLEGKMFTTRKSHRPSVHLEHAVPLRHENAPHIRDGSGRHEHCLSPSPCLSGIRRHLQRRRRRLCPRPCARACEPIPA
jgi:hypothetical protein